MRFERPPVSAAEPAWPVITMHARPLLWASATISSMESALSLRVEAIPLRV
jgi:hypothetical protein